MAKGDVDASRRQKAIEALARDPNVTAAARVSGYSRCYLQGKLLKNPEFVAKVEARRQELADEATPETAQTEIVDECIVALRAIVTGDGGNSMAVITAAKVLLNRFSPKTKKAGPSAPAAEPESQKPTLKFTPEEASRLLG